MSKAHTLLLEQSMGKDEYKAAVKEAVKEWLDSMFMTFGRWSFYSIGATALAALIYFVLWTNGWHRQ